MKIYIYTDGASRGNPGPSSYGFTIADEQRKILYEEGKFLGVNTNNFAEYSAVLAALEYVKENFKTSKVTFFMDSKLVAEQLSGRYKIKSPNLIPLIGKIKDLESKLTGVSYNHIPRAQNKQADCLANKALDDIE